MIEALDAAALPAPEDAPVILMVSGGSDSTALLVRAARGTLDLTDGRGPRRLPRRSLTVLHVNHCLRGEASDGDETFVRALCAELDVALRCARADVGALLAQEGGNLEDVARRVRYAAAWELAGELAQAAALERGQVRVLVAHTADDRAETFLMRAMAGAGAGGMTGMRRMRGVVVRPLLGYTRAELRAYLVEQGVGWREDATNAQDHATRSYVRNRVVPAIVERAPTFARTLGRSLDVLADEDDLLDRLAREALAAALPPMAGIAGPGRAVLDAAALAGMDPALGRRAVRLALADLLGPDVLERARLERRHVEVVLGLARAGTGSATLPPGVDVRAAAGMLVMTSPDAGADATPDAVLSVPGRTSYGGVELTAGLVEVTAEETVRHAAARAAAGALARVEPRVGLWGQGRPAREGRDVAVLDASLLDLGPLTVGAARAGERMEPFGLGVSKSVGDVLADAGVPGALRSCAPVVRDSACGVVWVPGARIDARAAWGDETRTLLVLNACSSRNGA